MNPNNGQQYLNQAGHVMMPTEILQQYQQNSSAVANNQINDGAFVNHPAQLQPGTSTADIHPLFRIQYNCSFCAMPLPASSGTKPTKAFMLDNHYGDGEATADCLKNYRATIQRAASNPQTDPDDLVALGLVTESISCIQCHANVKDYQMAPHAKNHATAQKGTDTANPHLRSILQHASLDLQSSAGVSSRVNLGNLHSQRNSSVQIPPWNHGQPGNFHGQMHQMPVNRQPVAVSQMPQQYNVSGNYRTNFQIPPVVLQQPRMVHASAPSPASSQTFSHQSSQQQQNYTFHSRTPQSFQSPPAPQRHMQNPQQRFNYNYHAQNQNSQVDGHAIQRNLNSFTQRQNVIDLLRASLPRIIANTIDGPVPIPITAPSAPNYNIQVANATNNLQLVTLPGSNASSPSAVRQENIKQEPEVTVEEVRIATPVSNTTTDSVRSAAPVARVEPQSRKENIASTATTTATTPGYQSVVNYAADLQDQISVDVENNMQIDTEVAATTTLPNASNSRAVIHLSSPPTRNSKKSITPEPSSSGSSSSTNPIPSTANSLNTDSGKENRLNHDDNQPKSEVATNNPTQSLPEKQSTNWLETMLNSLPTAGSVLVYICFCGYAETNVDHAKVHFSRHALSGDPELRCPRNKCGYLAQNAEDWGKHCVRHIQLQYLFQKAFKKQSGK